MVWSNTRQSRFFTEIPFLLTLNKNSSLLSLGFMPMVPTSTKVDQVYVTYLKREVTIEGRERDFFPPVSEKEVGQPPLHYQDR